ncbi:hypothetical protein B1H20_16860 [Streptomyces violaceoruber]|uniref:Uncharacterized protein n=1 Tax=Streptomyces violaceoruber TaxID=1935 RepID=A0A1V0UCA7_STRVN|nr:MULTISPECIES: hypothetical protein [Streptomyces]ARF62873.1 hypothetical protein B1H20_16860 [Streptomyces violaceoruber]
MASSDQLNDARDDSRLALYKAITDQVNGVADSNMTPQTAAAALKDLAEAFAWTTATTQPH